MERVQHLLRTADSLDSTLEEAKTFQSEAQKSYDDVRAEPPPIPAQTEWDKIDPLCTDRAKMMAFYHEHFGVIGLAKFIVRIAKFESTEEAKRDRDGTSSSSSSFDIAEDSADDTGTGKFDKSWKLILDDEQDDCMKSVYYLSSLPEEYIKALIAGNLPSRMQEPRFRRTVESYARAKDRQGTYAVYIAVNRVSAQSSQEDTILNSNAGRGLSLRQLQDVYRTMRLYINISDVRSEGLAKDIDMAISGSRSMVHSLDYGFQRRYGSGGDHDNFGRHRNWLDFIQSHYLDWANKQTGPDEQALDVPLQRCFVYVGLSKNVASRMTHHRSHTSTSSKVAGLLTATLQHLYPDVFSIVASSYPIFKTVSQDDIGFDEKLSAILAGAYPWDGGLNAEYAGRNKGAADDSEGALNRMRLSQQEIDSSGMINTNIDVSLERMTHVENVLDMLDNLPALRAKALQSSEANKRHADEWVATTKHQQACLRLLAMQQLQKVIEEQAKEDEKED